MELNMDDTDDFGDLYADLDDHVNAGIAGVLAKNGDLKPKESNLMSEERPRPLEEDKEERNENKENGWSSESEDDLHIVLNEGDCSGFPAAQGGVYGSGGMAEVDEDDEGESWRWQEQLQSGDGYAPATTAYRGRMQSYSAEIAVNGTNSTYRRSKWDPLLMPCSAALASCNFRNATITHIGLDFYLPRNRTIFDTNIEAFERKPWRDNGADITDFFNYGFDEGSWKSYCACMWDLFKEQDSMSMVPVCKSSKSVLFDMMTGVNNFSQKGEKFGPLLDNLGIERDELEMPNGRAIQVENGLGERVPTIDLRRPRYLDSDVVIQITLEDTVEKTRAFANEEHENAEGQAHLDDPALISKGAVHEGILLMDHEGRNSRKITNFIERSWRSSEQSVLRVATLDHKKDSKENPSRLEIAATRAQFNARDGILHYPCSSNAKSYSGASEKDELSLENIPNPSERVSLNSDSGFQESMMSECNLSDEFGSNTTKTEDEDIKGISNDCSVSPVGDKYDSKRRIEAVSGLHVQADSDPDLPYRKHQNYIDHMTRRHLSHNSELKMSFGHSGRRYTDKPMEDHFSEDFLKSGDHGPHSGRKNCQRTTVPKQKEQCKSQREQDNWGFRQICDQDSILSTSERTSFSMDKDQRLRKNRDGDCWVWTEAKYDETRIKHIYKDKYRHKMRERNLNFCDNTEGFFDIKFSEHLQKRVRTIKSPEKERFYDWHSRFGMDTSHKYMENDVGSLSHPKHRLRDSKIYRENALQKRCWHDTSHMRNHLERKLSERHMRCWQDLSMREIWSKDRSHMSYFSQSGSDCHLPYYKEDHWSLCSRKLDYGNNEFNVGEKHVYSGKVVSCASKSNNRPAMRTLCDQNDANLRHQEYLKSSNGSSHGRNPKDHSDRLDNNSPSSCKLYADCWLNNARRKIQSELSEENVSREFCSLDSGMYGKRMPDRAVIACEEAVCKNGNGWTGKVSRSCNRLGDGKYQHCLVDIHAVKQTKRLKHMKQEEAPRHNLNMKGNNCHSADSKVRKTKEKLEDADQPKAKIPFVSKGYIDDEIEEGELIEEIDDLEFASAKKIHSFVNRLADAAVEAHQSNHAMERNTHSEDALQRNILVRTYDSNHILETLAKMERRKKRFEEQVTLKQEAEKSLNPSAAIPTLASETQQQRPVRKRQWGAC